MQKKLIALAVAGLVSGGAFAQSNVTIYGVADATFDNVNASKQTAATHFDRLNRVSANSSYIGFKGEEALGNGLKAVFQLEGGLNNDAGASGQFGFSRDTFVGLASDSYGKVVLGTLTGPTRALGSAVDVFAGATGIGANTGVIGKLGNTLVGTTDANGAYSATTVARSSTQSSVFDTRWKNAIAYVSPTLAGFQGTAAYVANENKSEGQFGINTSGYDLGLTYTNGPIFGGITYNAVQFNNGSLNNPVVGLPGLNTKVSDFRVAGIYDFGVASVRALYEQTKLTADGISDLKQNVWGLGGTFNVTAAGKIVGQFYKANDVENLAGPNGARLWAVGYEHSLSKRTLLKATYANLKSDSGSAYDFGVNATGGAAAGGTVSGFQFGVRHSF
ncbi:porin [Rhodocyclus gracilis]|uniref:Porin n=1 Tax=Rhodocyclus tenuis TaxID=1066 RepID=A0A6L5K0A5_RHOTE|nr:porin [Rhodocyclus gracilis]MQY51918.1 porin [Rhodocyclus gracilis]